MREQEINQQGLLEGGGLARAAGMYDELWSPGRRVAGSLIGLGLIISGARQRGLGGAAMIAAGGALAVRGITNIPFSRLLGVGARRRAIQIHKSLKVHAPIDEVFRFWNDLENFPRFMAHVRDVRMIDAKRSHWTVTGPGGATVSWETDITHYRENELLAWRTLPGSRVEHAGVVKFLPEKDGSTRLDIRMSYTPPGGALGHVIASVFGSDPKTAMNDDLVRLKSLLERGAAITEDVDETEERPEAGARLLH